METMKVIKIGPPKIDFANFPFKKLTLIALVLLGFYFFNTFWFTVETEEVGLVLRFGRFVRETKPGLHLKMPSPAETVVKVPVQRQLKEEFGFRTEDRGTTQSQLEGEALMLTGDLNVADVEWITQYRINDPYKFLFKVKDIRRTFRDMNEAVLREVVGDMKVDSVLTTGRQLIESEAKKQLQSLCDQYETGITVLQIVLQDVNPPESVKPSFNEVNQAQQEKERMINDALAEYNKVVPKAKGEALQVIQQAEGYAAERVNQATGDAQYFKSLLDAYQKAPDVTRQRIFLETAAEVYSRMEGKIIIDKDVKAVMPLLTPGSANVNPLNMQPASKEN